MKKLVIPYHEQEKDYTCGPAVLRMVFAYFDAYYGESQIMRQTKTTKTRGTTRKRMLLSARQAGYWVYVQTDSTFEVIKWFICQQELPVIANYIEPDTNEGHYTVVTGFSNKGLFLHDPWNGKDFHLARRTFMKRWRGATEKTERWLMVIGFTDFRPLPHTEKEEILTGTFYDPVDLNEKLSKNNKSD